MKQLVILSGKGGTGKTTVAASFIELSRTIAFADCDVDAPNLHLVQTLNSKPEIKDFYGYQKAVKYDDLCIGCGKCERLCQFGAIKNGKVNLYECEGCGVCEEFCPSVNESGQKAIRLEDNVSGTTMVSINADRVFSTAELKMGNGASGKLVTEVRKNLYNSMSTQTGNVGEKRLSSSNKEFVIIDGSPGIGCPVIASVTGVDMVLVVTEPTLSGMHDMERIVETANKFGATCVICVNKYDVNSENTKKIEGYCIHNNIVMAGKIPFDKHVLEALNEGIPVVQYKDSPAGNAITAIWDTVSALLLRK